MINKISLRWLATVIITITLSFCLYPQGVKASEEVDWDEPYIIYTTVIGSTTYSVAFAKQSVFEKNSPLKLRAQPSQGMYDRLRSMKEGDVDKSKIIPIGSAADIKNLQKGQLQYEGYAMPDMRFVMTYTSGIYGLVTHDKDIKSIHDLNGKTVAVGKRTQVAYGQQYDQLLNEVIDSGARLRWAGTGPALKGLQDGLYDVAIALISAPLEEKDDGTIYADPEKAQPNPALEEIIAGRKQLYAVDLTRDAVNTLCEKRNYGNGAFPVLFPEGMLDIVPEGGVYWLGLPYGYHASTKVPAEVIKEFVLGCVKLQDKIVEYYRPYRILNPKTWTAGMEYETLHEGSKMAIKELGWEKFVIGWPESE